jgi:hypothetical protein
MRIHDLLLIIGIIFGTIGFILTISSVIFEDYIYEENDEKKKDKENYQRILLVAFGNIFTFIGFAFINGSILYKIL